MSFFANQKLAVRLGTAFGALALGLLVVATIGFTQMGSLRATTEDLNHREVREQALAATVSTLSLDVGQETANHLYVHDGDLAAQDDIQKDIAEMTATAKKDMAELSKLVKGGDAEAEARTFADAANRYFDLDAKTIAQSRQETVTKDEERSGSRGTYTTKLADIRGELDASGEKLLTAVSQEADSAAGDAVAQADSGRRNVLIAALIPLLLALGIAIYVTRSVTRP